MNEKQVAENLFSRIVTEGHAISLGEPTIHARLDDETLVGLSVPVTIKATEGITIAMEQTVRSLGGLISQASFRMSAVAVGLVLRMGNDIEVVEYFQKRIANLVFVWTARLTDGSSIDCYIAPDYMSFGNGTGGSVGALGLLQFIASCPPEWPRPTKWIFSCLAPHTLTRLRAFAN